MKLEIQERGHKPYLTTIQAAAAIYPEIETVLMGDADDAGWIVFNDGETQVRHHSDTEDGLTEGELACLALYILAGNEELQ
jgi:hypothetical protein